MVPYMVILNAFIKRDREEIFTILVHTASLTAFLIDSFGLRFVS